MPIKESQSSYFKSALTILLYLVAGGTAGFVIGSFVSGFFRLQQSHEAVLASSVLIGMILASLGRVRVPLFWCWFSLVFGLICLIPLWPWHTAMNVLGIQVPVPFVIMYFTTRPLIWKVFFLFMHTAIALSVAANIHIGWPHWKQQRFSQ
ncbi:MAG: hypothetical protein QM501_08775 [Gimesia sp.]